MIRSFKNWKAKRAAKRAAMLALELEQDYDGYSPSHDQTFVWPPALTVPWWAWGLLMVVGAVFVHHFTTFN